MIHFVTKQIYLFKSDKIVIEHDLSNTLTYLHSKRNLGLDTETNGLDPFINKVILLQIGDLNEQFVIDVGTIDISPLFPILTDENQITKVLHNAKFDYKMIKTSFGIEVENVFDTMLMEQLITNGLYDKKYVKKFKPYTLAALCKKYLELTISKEEQSSFINHTGAFREEQIIYAANDVVYALNVARHLLPQLKYYELMKVANLENEVVLAYADIELNGIKIDVDKWMGIYRDNLVELKSWETKLDNYVRQKPVLYERFKRRTDHAQQLNLFTTVEGLDLEIKWSAPKDVLTVLNLDCLPDLKGTSKNELELLVYEDEKTGLFTPIDPAHEIVAMLLNYRTYRKAVDTYGEKFLENIHPKTGRIHPTFYQIGADDAEDNDGSGGTATGRVSCQKPNLQNIKADSEFRKCFVAEPKYSFITNDYSGCELRFIAEGSGDPVFIEAFNKNEDVHSRVASMLYRKPVSKKENSELRAPAKNLNFGLAYGMGADKLARKLRITKKEAQDLMDLYFKTFPLIKKFLETNGNFAKAYGFIRTPAPYGRIRWFPEWEESKDNFGLRGKIERAGKNTPIQGANADLTKKATVLVRKWFKAQNAFFGYPAFKLVNQVHDEICAEVDSDLAIQGQENILFCMEMAANDMVSKVPMTAESKIDTCWNK